MATTGTKLTIPFLVGAGQIVGQGNGPELWASYSTDDVSVTNPIWIDASALVRTFSTARGTESELADFDAGTATVVVDNRTRIFDPSLHPLIRPLNRWRLQEQFTGETNELFIGYAESYDNQWPDWGGSDAECLVSCADEFSVLARDSLPTTNPPRSSYADVVGFDNPADYWEMNDDLTVTSGGAVAPAPEPNPIPPVQRVPAARTPSRGKGWQ